MESTVRGVVLDSNILIAAERAGRTTLEVIREIRNAAAIGDAPVILPAIVVAEIGHGIYRAESGERRMQRRRFLDELKAAIPVHPFTASTAEIAARIGGEQAALGINLPLADLLIGSSALELGYAVVTNNRRDFERIPGLTIIPI